MPNIATIRRIVSSTSLPLNLEETNMAVLSVPFPKESSSLSSFPHADRRKLLSEVISYERWGS